jgi:hypothetical protein
MWHRYRVELYPRVAGFFSGICDPLGMSLNSRRLAVEGRGSCVRATKPWRILDNLRGLDHLLITSRIAQGLTHRELARRLGVHETEVSRGERNEYFGITLERAAEILDALSVADAKPDRNRTASAVSRPEGVMGDPDPGTQ